VQTEIVSTVCKYVFLNLQAVSKFCVNSSPVTDSSSEAMTGRSELTGSKIVLADPVAARSKSWV